MADQTLREALEFIVAKADQRAPDRVARVAARVDVEAIRALLAAHPPEPVPVVPPALLALLAPIDVSPGAFMEVGPIEATSGISDEAIDAACRAYNDESAEYFPVKMRAALEAVRPHLAPQPNPCPHAWEEINPGHWVCKELCGTDDVDLTRSPDWSPTPTWTPGELKHVRNRCPAALSMGQCILPAGHDPVFGSLPHIMEDGNLFSTGEPETAGPRPLLDRAAVLGVLRERHYGGVGTKADYDASVTDEIMPLARPMPTREQIHAAMMTLFDEYSEPSVDQNTDAVLALLTGSDS